MNFRNTLLVVALVSTSSGASAQWITFTNQTGARLAGNDPAKTTACPEEKDYAWGDVDHDGDLDVIVMRKRPFSCPGGRPNLLLMNEGGVLIDRAGLLASTAINVPAPDISQGFLDNTNDRQAVLVDVNNDGWLDLVTCCTLSDGLKRYIGYPRVYMNMGSSGGVWQGFRYEFNRLGGTVAAESTAFIGPPAAANPRFCGVAAGDVNSDGYVDLFFTDYDRPEFTYCGAPTEAAGDDFNNRVMINKGASNPGYFKDETSARLGTLANANFGAHCLIADINGDGNKDIMRVNTLITGQNVAAFTNPAAGTGFWTATNSKSIYPNLAPYGISTGDLNGDGRLDVLVSDDSFDRIMINTGNDGNSNPNFSITTIPGSMQSWFSGQNSLSDLDNDGWLDAIIPDQDIDTDYDPARRTQFFRNVAGALSEATPGGMSGDFIKAVYNTANPDIDGDGWRDFIMGRGNAAGGVATGSTEVYINNGKPGLTFSFPGGRPTSLAPGSATNFDVQLSGLKGGVPMANSGQIFLSINGGAFAPTSMTPVGGNLYQATIPAQDCGTSIRYYFRGQISTGTAFVDPAPQNYAGSTPPFHYLVGASSSTTVALSDDFESGAGSWTVQNDGSLVGGAWEVATPVGTWNEGLKAAPDSDNSPVGDNAFVTQNGLVGGALNAGDVDGGPTNLISPVIDLAGSNATISFARWFYSNGGTDTLQVSLSNDGGANWTIAATYAAPPMYNWNSLGAEYKQTEWTASTINVGDHVIPTAQVRIRFTANDFSPGSIYEAGIDDVVVAKYTCVVPCPADVNGSGAVNIDDLVIVITSWGNTKGAADINHDNIVNIDDLVMVITSWGDC